MGVIYSFKSYCWSSGLKGTTCPRHDSFRYYIGLYIYPRIHQTSIVLLDTTRVHANVEYYRQSQQNCCYKILFPGEKCAMGRRFPIADNLFSSHDVVGYPLQLSYRVRQKIVVISNAINLNFQEREARRQVGLMGFYFRNGIHLLPSGNPNNQLFRSRLESQINDPREFI